jgi:hypothetical protein
LASLSTEQYPSSQLHFRKGILGSISNAQICLRYL